MPKYCSFCDQKNTPRSDEHVVPKWMTKLYPHGAWAIENRLTKHVRHSTKYVHLTIPLCELCNNGWMSQLEQKAIPILTPLIEGNRLVLSPDDQAIMKSWLCLRAMVYDLHSEIYAPRPRYFTNDEHHELATSLSYHPYYQFFLGRYRGSQEGLLEEDHFDVTFLRQSTGEPVGNVTRGYSMTLVFKRLVLQTLCIKSPEPLIHVGMPDMQGHCFQFGEPFAINSFPPFAFGDNAINDFVHRWSKYMQVAPGFPPDTE